MSDFYILDENKKPVNIYDLENKIDEFKKQIENKNRTIDALAGLYNIVVSGLQKREKENIKLRQQIEKKNKEIDIIIDHMSCIFSLDSCNNWLKKCKQCVMEYAEESLNSRKEIKKEE
jgi:hypothetical protein